MSRLRRIEQGDRFFFITTNLRRSVAPFSPSERTIVLDLLDRERRRDRFYLFGYVVMPTHVHLLLEPGDQGLTIIQ
jgi:REP element-mobilizing transposase RayT